MKLNKKFMAGLLCLSLIGMVGCSSKKSEDAQKEATKTEEKMKIEVSEKNPIIVDKEAKTVTVLSQVNGKYFTEPTRHASVEKSGSNGTKSVLTAYATPEQFYNGLIEIGAKAGENMNPEDRKSTRLNSSHANISYAVFCLKKKKKTNNKKICYMSTKI